MRKFIFILFIIMVTTSCGTYRSSDSMSQLRSGMTKQDVEYYLGRPIRVLAVEYQKNGVQEVLAFSNEYDEVYAVEFWNNYLVKYEYLYDDRPYVVPAPPAYLPPAGRPIIIVQDNDRRTTKTRRSTSGRSSSRSSSRSESSSSGRSESSTNSRSESRPNTSSDRPTSNGRSDSNTRSRSESSTSSRSSSGSSSSSDRSQSSTNTDQGSTNSGRSSQGRSSSR